MTVRIKNGFRLKDKFVLVTGSGSGIGKATARLFLEEGARVLIHALSEAEVQSCLDDLSKFDKVLGNPVI